MKSRTSRANRRDANEPDIVRDLRAIGCSVMHLHEWDLLVGYRGKDYKIEVKMPDGKPTQAQIDLAGANWKGSPLYFVKTSEEAIAVVTGKGQKYAGV